MVGLVHLPAGDPGKIAEKAADIAAGVQASMSVTLPQIVPDVQRLQVAVGVAMNDTVVACLGQYAKRNALVLGPAATKAEQIQMHLDGKQTGIDKVAYDHLPGSGQTLYTWDTSAKAYVADDLDSAKQARVKESLSSNGQRTLTPDGAGRMAIGAAAAAAGLAVGVVAARVSRSERVSSSGLTPPEPLRTRFEADREVMAEVMPLMRHYVWAGGGHGALAQGLVDVDVGAGCFEQIALDIAFGPRYPRTPPQVFDADRRWCPIRPSPSRQS